MKKKRKYLNSKEILWVRVELFIIFSTIKSISKWKVFFFRKPALHIVFSVLHNSVIYYDDHPEFFESFTFHWRKQNNNKPRIVFMGIWGKRLKYFILNPDSRLLVPFHYFILYWSLHWRWRTGKMLKCKQTLKNTQTCQSGRRMEKGSILKPESDVSYMINMIYDCWL